MELFPVFGKTRIPAAMPQSIGAMLQDMYRGLERAWRAEVILVPVPMSSTAKLVVAFTTTETGVAQLASLLISAPDEQVTQKASWALAESIERFAGLLRWLASTVVVDGAVVAGHSSYEARTASQQMSNHRDALQPSHENIAAHGVFLQQVSEYVSHAGGLIHNSVDPIDPAHAAAARCQAAAKVLQDAAVRLQQLPNKDGFENSVHEPKVFVNRSIQGLICNGSRTTSDLMRRKQVDERLKASKVSCGAQLKGRADKKSAHCKAHIRRNDLK